MSGYEHERSFELFGSHVRLLVGPPSREDLPSSEQAAIEVEALLRTLHRRLTRFDRSSELSIMNANPAIECSVSPLLALAVRAGLWAAEQTQGLVDPTLVGELEQAGYARSRAGVPAASLGQALAAAPPRRPARPAAGGRWREMSVDQAAALVHRPPGLLFDTGGTGKGLAADLGAGRLDGYETYAVDAGGDLRIGGSRSTARAVDVEHPLSGDSAASFGLVDGAVATSGLATRLWRQGGGFAHHLLDPSTGEPAWTGVIQATALGPTAVAAETVAKQALLLGPEHGRELLSERGGVLILDDGTVEPLGAVVNLISAELETAPLAVSA